MGQKTNAIGFRIGFNKTWDSSWYNDFNYSSLINEDLLIKNYLINFYKKIGVIVSKCLIKRSLNKVLLYLFVYNYDENKYYKYIRKNYDLTNQKQKQIEKAILIKNIQNLYSLNNSKYSLILINITDISYNANLLAQYIAQELENHLKESNFKEIASKALKRIKNFKIKGIDISCSGCFNRAEMAKTLWKQKYNIMPLHTLDANIDYSIAEAKTLNGVYGVKVWICYQNFYLSKPSLKK
jgi:small subunit ribosomal protein S3